MMKTLAAGLSPAAGKTLRARMKQKVHEAGSELTRQRDRDATEAKFRSRATQAVQGVCCAQVRRSARTNQVVQLACGARGSQV
jgi:hypothetical protein